MRNIFTILALMPLSCVGCTVYHGTCDCYDPPTAEVPIKISVLSSVLGTGASAEAAACEQAKEDAEDACYFQGGSPENAECEPYQFDARKTGAGSTLSPIPDSTVPKARD